MRARSQRPWWRRGFPGVWITSPGGLTKVTTDATLTGAGTVASPLSVVGGGGSGATPTVIGFVTSTGDTSHVAISSTLSAGTIQAGDQLLIFLNTSSTENWNATPAPLAGWNPLITGNVPTSGQTGIVLARTATSAEPSSYSVLIGNCTAVMLCTRGASRTLPVVNNATPAGAAPVVNGTYAPANTLIIACLQLFDSRTLTTAPTAYTTIANNQLQSGGHVYLGQQSTTAAGVVADDTSGVFSAAADYGCYTVGLSAR